MSTPWLRVYELEPPVAHIGAKIAIWADVRQDPGGDVIEDDIGRIVRVVAGLDNLVYSIANTVHSNAHNVGGVVDGRWSR